MKKLLLLIVSLTVVFGLTACDELCIGPECITEANVNPDDDVDPEECDTNGETSDIDTSNILEFTHLNGHGVESQKYAYVLYEFPARDYVKYQITYLACTCRDAKVNYWSTAHVVIAKGTNEILEISYTDNGDSEHPYDVGFWGDSSPTPEGVYFEQFEDFFFTWLIGKSYADLDGISYFANGGYFEVTPNTVEIENTLIDFDSDEGTPEVGILDAFAGSSVSTNNILRVFKELLLYHEANND